MSHDRRMNLSVAPITVVSSVLAAQNLPELTTLVTEDAINAQFESLLAAKTIRSDVKTGDVDTTGFALDSTISSVKIKLANDTFSAYLLVTLNGGAIQYYKGFGPSATLQNASITHWTVCFSILLGTETVTATSLPLFAPQVANRVKALLEQSATVQRFFLNFDKTVINSLYKPLSKIGTDPVVESALVSTLGSWLLSTFSKNANPFTLACVSIPNNPRDDALLVPVVAQFSGKTNVDPQVLPTLTVMMMATKPKLPNTISPPYTAIPSDTKFGKSDFKLSITNEYLVNVWVLPYVMSSVSSTTNIDAGSWTYDREDPSYIVTKSGNSTDTVGETTFTSQWTFHGDVDFDQEISPINKDATTFSFKFTGYYELTTTATKTSVLQKWGTKRVRQDFSTGFRFYAAPDGRSIVGDTVPIGFVPAVVEARSSTLGGQELALLSDPARDPSVAVSKFFEGFNSGLRADGATRVLNQGLTTLVNSVILPNATKEPLVLSIEWNKEVVELYYKFSN